MSGPRLRPRDLLGAYSLSLDRQIQERGSSLACRDEGLRLQVEELLLDGDAVETHCHGLDPLSVMEEALEAAAGGGRRLQARGGLRGLAKAFEVLEQAALNLYLGPWREEYKVIKMHSGTFTHYILPVLPRPQIQTLFSLLGYQASAARPEQLRLGPARLGTAALDLLLRLACAFYLARCECRLLLAGLGKRSGDAEWELSVVRERRRGAGLQVALDNTKKALVEPVDEDLYGDEQVNGDTSSSTPPPPLEGDDDDDDGGVSGVVAPPAGRTHSNGVTSSSSHLEVELSSRKPLRSRSERSESPGGLELSADPPDAAAIPPCRCLQAAGHGYYQRCLQCDSLHDITCRSLDACRRNDHALTFLSDVESSCAAAVSACSLSDGPQALSPLSAIPPLASSPLSSMTSISFHGCCDLARLDPRLLCFGCSVFHAASCRDAAFCRGEHPTRELGECVSCRKPCQRNPLVLCRYCGNEFCNTCWYRNPVSCSCGQTFDQSSSV